MLDCRALYTDVIEEHAGSDRGLGNCAQRVRDVRIVTNGDDVGAETASVELVKDCAADELTGAIGLYAVEKTRKKFSAESLDGVDVFALLFCHAEQTFVEFFFRYGLIGLDKDDAGT